MPKLTLTRAARHAFSAEARSRGGKLVRFRRVLVDDAGEGWISGTVRGGTDAFSVVVGVRPPAVLVDCTCDAFEREGPCAHVWSVLLAAERTRARALAPLSVEPLHARAAAWRARAPESIRGRAVADDPARGPAG